MKISPLRTCCHRLLAASIVPLLVAPSIAAEPSSIGIGEIVVSGSSLRDPLGNIHVLSDIDAEATVLAFVGTECPLASLEIPKLIRMSEIYGAKDVDFILVYPNEPETLVEIAAHSYERDVPFLVLKDFDSVLADRLGVTRTPTVCVLDKHKTLRYRGRIDDQYSVASRRAKARRYDLQDALDALLSGREITAAEVQADGCPLNREKPQPLTGDWTWFEHIEPIVRESCVDCHRPGQIGPMTLTSYDDVADHAETILEVVQQRRMPPWHADRRYGHFINDRELTKEQVGIMTAWFDAGMPRGNKPAGHDSLTAAFNDEWKIEPEAVYEMPETAEIPADGVVPYIYYVIPTNFEKDRWVVAAEAKAGNASVVHHIIAYFVAPGRGSFYSGDGDIQILAIGGPGEGVTHVPEGTALRVPRGAELILEMHYTPNGVATTDRSKVGLVFADSPPERELRIHMFGSEDLAIPPHAPHHAETADFTFAKDGQIYAMLPHMHWRGKSWEGWIDGADGKRDILLSVPRYDFNWQTYYRFAQPVAAAAGTTVRSVAHWDNSSNNPSNPDPSIEVNYGLQSSEEMMYGFLTYIYDEPVQESPPAKTNMLVKMMFDSMDSDKNGLVETDEVPAELQKQLDAAGMQIRGGLTPLLLEAIMN